MRKLDSDADSSWKDCVLAMRIVAVVAAQVVDRASLDARGGQGRMLGAQKLIMRLICCLIQRARGGPI